MLIIAISILLLAVTSSIERNYNYLADYIKFNRIVFIIFILGAYLAYNTLNVDALSEGIGIYGGVFRITTLSQVFDIILFIVGSLVSILTCFVPYNLKKYNYNKVENYSSKDYMNVSESNFGIINKLKRTLYFFSNFRLSIPYIIGNRLDFRRLEVKEYSLLLLFTVLGGSLLISSHNLISIYLALELQSFTLYILSTSQINSFKGTSGGLKYFLLGGLSSGFILLGCSLLYAYTGTLNLEHIFMIYSDNISNYFIDPCLLVLFAGLLFKVSAAPFHNWAPDVYSDVPTYSTTWLIIIAKLSIFILMLILIHHIHSGLNLNNLGMVEQNYSFLYKDTKETYIDWNVNSLYLKNEIFFSFWNPFYSSLGLWTNVLTISAILSFIVGTVLGISQSRIKRLFAFSTIAHVGFLLLALSLNSVTSIDAFIFYLIQYTFTNLNLFFILISWGYLYSRYYLEKDFVNVRYSNINPFSWKDVYVESSLSDIFDSIKDKYGKEKKISNIYPFVNSIDNNKKRINTLYSSYSRDSSIFNSDFDLKENEWLYTPIPYLTHFKGMHYTDPFLAFCLAVTLFSLAGIPPFIGFFAKQQVLLASMQLDYYFVSAVAVLTSVISAAYYLRIVKFIYFYDNVFVPYYLVMNNKEDSDSSLKSEFIFNSLMNWNNELEKNNFILSSNNLSLIIALLTNIIMFYILKPYILINTIYMITIPLFQG